MFLKQDLLSFYHIFQPAEWCYPPMWFHLNLYVNNSKVCNYSPDLSSGTHICILLSLLHISWNASLYFKFVILKPNYWSPKTDVSILTNRFPEPLLCAFRRKHNRYLTDISTELSMSYNRQSDLLNCKYNYIILYYTLKSNYNIVDVYWVFTKF